MRPSQPNRGEIWLVDLDPTRGHEQAGTRPCLVVSTNAFNHGPAELVWVLPMTTRERRIPFHVPVTPGSSGLRATSFIKVEDLRSVSMVRLSERIGDVPSATMAEVEERLRILLEL